MTRSRHYWSSDCFSWASHSRLGARWAIPALALVPPFLAFNVAATPDPPVIDLGPVIGMYFTVLSVWVVWLGTRRAGYDVAARSGRNGREGRIPIGSAATPS